jgi:hypothetical protein
MRQIRWCGAAVAVLAACAAAPAQAPTVPVLRVGQTANGTLAASDPTLSEHGHFKVYRFDARQGQRLVVTMRSKDFDAFLTLARTVGGITDPIKTDDDRGGDTDARIRFTADRAGQYLVIAQALAEDGLGAFSVSLEAASEPTTAQPRAISLGQNASGTLAETDAVLDDDDTFYDTWTITGRKGQRLLVDMGSEAFDAYLSFGRMENGEFSSIATNDDVGRENTDARIRVTLPEDGQYVIRANSVGAGATGPYTLVVTERAPAAEAAAPVDLRAGQEVSASLDDNDPVMEDESFYDYYVYEGRQGEEVTVTMASEDFDTFLAIGRMDGDTFSELSSNDDGTDGTNSALTFTLPENGRYIIRANSLSAGNTGAYKLKLESSRNR